MKIKCELEESDYIPQPVIWIEIDADWIRVRLNNVTRFCSDTLWIARLVGASLLVISVIANVSLRQFSAFVLSIAFLLFIFAIAKYRVVVSVPPSTATASTPTPEVTTESNDK